MRRSLLPLVFLLCSAFDKPFRWDQVTTPLYPVVPVLSCPNTFATSFPGFSWTNIRGHALTAANEWFVHGNSDVRLRVRDDLAASDPRCNGSVQANAGEVLFVGESTFGGGGCGRIASAFCSLDGVNRLTRCKVILHRGCTPAPNQPVQQYNWAPNAGFPAATQIDFLEVILHEFGHALGFLDNAATPNTAVMFPSVTASNTPRRNLSRDDLVGMRDVRNPYPPIETTSLHRWRSASSTGPWSVEPEPTTAFLFGAPSVDFATRFVTSDFYGMAFSRSSDRKLMFGRTNGSGGTFSPISHLITGGPPFFFQFIQEYPLQRPPAFVGDSNLNREVIAFVGDTEAAELSVTTNDGSGWSVPSVVAGTSSRVGPSLAYLSNRNLVVMAWPASPSGFIRIRTSSNGGQSFGSEQEFGLRTYSRLGLLCAQADQCTLVYSDGQQPYSPLVYATLNYNSAFGTFNFGQSGVLGFDSYGAGLDSDGSTSQVVWRDRGTLTVPGTGRWVSPGTFNNQAFLDFPSHSAPDVAHNASWAEFTFWTTFAARYNQ